MADNDIPQCTDVLVIGAGPGGYAAAFEAAKLGLDVTLVNDEAEPGGVCLRRGCIPSKTLLHLTELVHAADAAGTFGLTFDAPKVDLDTIRDRKNKVIDQLTGGVAQLCKQRGVRLLQARATFEDRKRVKLAGEQSGQLGFGAAIIVTGSRPTALPGIDFSDRFMSSTEALELADIPESLLVIGGGYIGLEMGAPAEDMALSIHPHPTLTETLGEGAELFTGPATHYG